MTHIPAQRTSGSAQVYQTWQQAGLGPDSVVDLGDETSMTLRELLDEGNDQDPDEE